MSTNWQLAAIIQHGRKLGKYSHVAGNRFLYHDYRRVYAKQGREQLTAFVRGYWLGLGQHLGNFS